jgi:hypothetical protein
MTDEKYEASAIARYQCAKGHVLVHPGDLCTICDEEFYAGEQWTKEEAKRMSARRTQEQVDAVFDEVMSMPADQVIAEATKQLEDRIASSQVNHPAHYGGADNPYEVIKVLEAWLTPEQMIGFLKGNVIKYLGREGKKPTKDDIGKASWYATYLADFEKRHGVERRVDGAVSRQLQAVIKKHGLIRGKVQELRKLLEAESKIVDHMPPELTGVMLALDEILRIG